MPGRPITKRLPRPRLLGLLGGVGVAATALINTLQVRSMRSRAKALADVQHSPVHLGAGPGPAVRSVAVLGDSAARGFAIVRREDIFSARPAEGLAGLWAPSSVQVTCHAVDGARTLDVARAQVAALSGTEDLIVIGVGVNDGLKGTRVGALAEATHLLVDRVQTAAPTAQIVVVTCPDLQAAPGFPWPFSGRSAPDSGASRRSSSERSPNVQPLWRSRWAPPTPTTSASTASIPVRQGSRQWLTPSSQQ